MNLVEINRLKQVESLLDVVLDGKVENLKQAKKAKEILNDMLEFKDIESKEAWKYALEE